MTKAIFLGTFDPPHRGHEICLESVIDCGVMEKLGIEKIHLIPAWCNPNKQTRTNYVNRYKMCFKMIAHNDKLCEHVFLDDIENVFEPSFTFQLIDEIKSGHDDYIPSDFWWIITEETLGELIRGEWKRSKSLLDNNKFILLVDGELSDNIKEWVEVHEDQIEIVKLIEHIDVHSTNIRNILFDRSNEYRISELERTGWISVHVLNHIILEGLYSEN